MNESYIQIGKRTFSLTDQLDFADLSGDNNPIHIDPLEARKTIGGACIVHGVNGFLWVLECLVSTYNFVPKNLKIDFLKPIYVDTHVICFWSKLEKTIKIVNEEADAVVSISYDDFIIDSSHLGNFLLPKLVELSSPKRTSFNNLDLGTKYKSEYGGKIVKVETLFSHLSSYLGDNTVYEVSILSNIVGMQVPGLHSLFSKLEISFIDHPGCITPFYQVTKKDERFGLIELEYTGSNFTSKIVAFERPHYESKKCSEIKELIPALKNLKNKKILIIGGSRGIGAACARVSSMLGADVTLTYSVGASDAQYVCADIKSYCNRIVKTIPLDINNPCDIESLDLNYDILCYFASPKISQTKGDFSLQTFDKFYTFYCKSFEKIAMQFSNCGGSLIYWPSTVFLEQEVTGFNEYILAKEIGEKVCKNLEYKTNMKIIIERLEKIQTDQTLSVMRQPLLDAVSVSINIANLMSFHANE